MRTFLSDKDLAKPEVIAARAALTDICDRLDADTVDRLFAGIVSERRETEWSKRRGLKMSSSRWWGLLIGKRDFSRGMMFDHKQLPASDHTSLWNKDGKPHLFVSQPYGLHTEDIRKIAAACDEHGLDVQIHTHPGWHFPGHVLHMTWTARQQANVGAP